MLGSVSGVIETDILLFLGFKLDLARLRDLKCLHSVYQTRVNDFLNTCTLYEVYNLF